MREPLQGADYILTYSKIRFNPLQPVEEDIRIEDIAHALSLTTRANGHFAYFYSVAQHCINCSREALARGYSRRVQLGCLLHDASESYISDLTRPVKRRLEAYSIFEEKLQNMIYGKFGLKDLDREELMQIEDVDDTLLHLEFKAIMGVTMFESAPESSVNHDFSQRDFAAVEKEFIDEFNKLVGK